MRSINKLSAKQIEAFKEPGRYSDGGNLYLVVTQARTRQWVFRYRWHGKLKELGLGSAAQGGSPWLGRGGPHRPRATTSPPA